MSRTLLPAAGALIVLLALGPAAIANDSSAEKAAGGLVLRQNRDIDMVSEDLYVSPAEVRVRYVFRNRPPQTSGELTSKVPISVLINADSNHCSFDG